MRTKMDLRETEEIFAGLRANRRRDNTTNMNFLFFGDKDRGLFTSYVRLIWAQVASVTNELFSVSNIQFSLSIHREGIADELSFATFEELAEFMGQSSFKELLYRKALVILSMIVTFNSTNLEGERAINLIALDIEEVKSVDLFARSLAALLSRGKHIPLEQGELFRLLEPILRGAEGRCTFVVEIPNLIKLSEGGLSKFERYSKIFDLFDRVSRVK
eukprot:TRINITY_DN3845_c0_g1_i1.p1 TRINITY_DN3845_c0_g1~~TRINITY_DN3845_c0_g1_i1.p1  ORF type:complete len:217 (-),score=52.23 TRINITY_DN3845_c0_g1_i1:58-708(-)